MELQPGPVFGALAFIAAATLWLLLTRPPLLVTALLFASFWPVVLALPTTMQEPLHFAIGCVLAPLLLRLLKDDDPRPRTLIACALVLCLASLVRPVWALLAIPLGWHLGGARDSFMPARASRQAERLMCVLYAAFMTIAAPYPGTGSPSSRISLPIPATPFAASFDAPRSRAPRTGWLKTNQPLERLVRGELIGLALLTGVLSLRRTTGPGVTRVDRFVAATIVLLVAAVLTLGTIGS